MGTEDRAADLSDGGRDETEAERLDRNWSELLQELRVTQTGTQIITGFLLTVPFQSRFEELDLYQMVAYLIVVSLAVTATMLSLAPVNLHRLLFRKQAKRQIVEAADRILRLALLTIGLVIAGVVLLVFDIVGEFMAGTGVGRPMGIIAALVTAAVLIALWVVVPYGAHPRRRNH
ncbi:DUF6328 family protein [Herbiconiux sp. SYSU D00978]|uniref:DUF6328 family protein n=1 Tax=Herbiconiux sp. SYSU D00978 TaxID=2812562 RepID=UPI001A9581B6|nr:DUF6328 family protein [Herbiconiux sp. SYSU D00978]